LLTTRYTTLAVAALALIGLAAARPAAAQTTITATTYFSATFINSQSDPKQYSLGYSFMTTNALDVTALGYLNDGATGANATHQVDIYKITSGSAGDPLAGTALFAPITVATIGSTPLDNTFSYTTLTAPVLLSANTAYEIVANNNGNGYAINAQGVFYGGGIRYGVSTYNTGATTAAFDPSTYQPNNIGNFGPNFEANVVSPAPEPSQVAGLGFAVLGIAGLLLKARRKTAAA